MDITLVCFEKMIPGVAELAYGLLSPITLEDRQAMASQVHPRMESGYSDPTLVALWKQHSATQRLQMISTYYDLDPDYSSKVQRIDGRQPLILSLDQAWQLSPCDRVLARYDHSKRAVIVATHTHPHIGFRAGGPALYKTAAAARKFCIESRLESLSPLPPKPPLGMIPEVPE